MGSVIKIIVTAIADNIQYRLYFISYVIAPKILKINSKNALIVLMKSFDAKHLAQ